MLNYIKTCEYLFLTFYVQSVIININRTVKSRQISNTHTHGFLAKCKTYLILSMVQSKSLENNKNNSWNYTNIKRSNFLCKTGRIHFKP